VRGEFPAAWLVSVTIEPQVPEVWLHIPFGFTMAGELVTDIQLVINAVLGLDWIETLSTD